MVVGVTGGKKARSTVGSMPNKGCIFGSIASYCGCSRKSCSHVST